MWCVSLKGPASSASGYIVGLLQEEGNLEVFFPAAPVPWLRPGIYQVAADLLEVTDYRPEMPEEHQAAYRAAQARPRPVLSPDDLSPSRRPRRSRTAPAPASADLGGLSDLIGRLAAADVDALADCLTRAIRPLLGRLGGYFLVLPDGCPPDLRAEVDNLISSRLPGNLPSEEPPDVAEPAGPEGQTPLGWAIVRKEGSPFYGRRCFWTVPPVPGVSRPELRYTVRLVLPEGHRLARRSLWRNYFESDLEFIPAADDVETQDYLEESSHEAQSCPVMQ